MHLGQLDEAKSLAREMLRDAADARDITSVSALLRDTASLFALTGDYERAAKLVAAAQRIVDESGGEPPPQLVNRVDPIPALREHLSPDELTHLLADGRALNEDAALELALRE